MREAGDVYGISPASLFYFVLQHCEELLFFDGCTLVDILGILNAFNEQFLILISYSVYQKHRGE